MTQANLMSLGLFVFRIDTAPFNKLVRSTKFMWAKKHAIGKGPTYQYLGLEQDKITISGHLAPPITGGLEQIDNIRNMGLQGKSWNLVTGAGQDLGAWFINDIEITGTELAGDGTPRFIEFDLRLELAPDLATLGKLSDSRGTVERRLAEINRISEERLNQGRRLGEDRLAQSR